MTQGMFNRRKYKVWAHTLCFMQYLLVSREKPVNLDPPAGFPFSIKKTETLFSAYYNTQPRTPYCPINSSVLGTVTSPFFS